MLWFEKSNTYSVISSANHWFLNNYLETKSEKTFIQNCQKHRSVTVQESKLLYDELKAFLNEVNTPTQPTPNKNLTVGIPQPALTKYYSFGSSNISINYASENIVALIHPYLQHGCVAENQNADTVFDIFNDSEHLYLVKNKIFIGNYETKNFHFLQGKFAMELVSSIYGNTEFDWLATFHASTVCNGQEAIMIIGDSGNGKSTLSAILMAHGFDLLADDFTPMLAENQHLYRFPAAISIKKGAFEMMETLFGSFGTLESQINSSKRLTVKYLPPSITFETSQKHFACRKIVMVNYSEGNKSELSACTSEKLLQTLIPDAWISPHADHSKKFLNWLKDLKFYELTYSDNQVAVAKFKELFAL